MKTFTSTLCIVIATLPQTLSGTPTNFAIGLSPSYAVPESEQIERCVKKFILDSPKGSRIRVDDAFNLRTVVVFNVPDARYDSPANRVRTMTPSFGTLITWFRQARTNAVSSVAGVVRVPEYLDSLAAEGTGQTRGILLFGNPLMAYPTEPSFAMTGGSEGPRVPSDGHLLAPLTSTPYGCVERKGRLRGSQISWCYGSENVWSNGLHKTLVMRFWTLFAKQQDAALITFTADLASAFAALPQAGRDPVVNIDLNPDDTKIEMRVARPRSVPNWLPQSGAETTPARVSASQSPTMPISRQSGSVSGGATQAAPVRSLSSLVNLAAPLNATVDIGIMWESSDASLDLDLYVKARPGTAELSYQKVRTPEGMHVRDWREPNNRTDFEWVKLNPGARLGEIEAWVNLFKGRGPISGRVAIHFENRTFTGSFHISATSGNGGIDAANRATSLNWTRLNLQQILTQNQ